VTGDQYGTVLHPLKEMNETDSIITGQPLQVIDTDGDFIPFYKAQERHGKASFV
jgi:hypothetical protein